MDKEKRVLLNKKGNQNLKEKAAELRKYIILMNCYADSGHPGGSLSAAEIKGTVKSNYDINKYIISFENKKPMEVYIK